MKFFILACFILSNVFALNTQTLKEEKILASTADGSFLLINHPSCVELRSGSDKSQNLGLDWSFTSGGGLYGYAYGNSHPGKNLIYKEMLKLERNTILSWNRTSNGKTFLNPIMAPLSEFERFGKYSIVEESENMDFYSLISRDREDKVKISGRFIFSEDSKKLYVKDSTISDNSENTNKGIRFAMLYIDDEYASECLGDGCSLRRRLQCGYRESLDLREIDKSLCVWIDYKSRHSVNGVQKPYCW